MTFKVAIIGAGRISRNHLDAIRSIAQLEAVGIADINQESARLIAAEFQLNAYTDYCEMVQREKPDIIVITLPHYLHKEAAVWCAEQGCHILLEKPMALNSQECTEIIDAAFLNNVKLAVGHTQHYIAENIRAKQIIKEGTLGNLVMIHDVRHDYYYSSSRPAWFFEKAKSGGGIFMNFGSHSVDKIQWLTDSKVIKVKASVSHYGEKGDIEGSGIALLATSCGIPATICQSGYVGVEKNVTELIFTNGMMRLASGEALWISELGEYKRIEIDRQDQSFILPFQELLRSIESDTEPECSGIYAKSVVSVIEAMYESHLKDIEISVSMA